MLTYPGDVTSIVGEVKGPNIHGRMFEAFAADYDTAINMTRVAFREKSN